MRSLFRSVLARTLTPCTRTHARTHRTHARTLPATPQIKPDGVARGLVGEIIARFEKKGYRLVAMKLMQASKALLEQHYADLAGRPFFPGLVGYMASGPVCCMVWEGFDAVAGGRRLLGATKPSESAPGTIRGDFALVVGRNICHGSDSVENAKKEIALWFTVSELTVSTHPESTWIYE